MEENRKISLAKEVMRQLYDIAKYYKALAEKQEQEILRLKENLKNSEENNRRSVDEQKDVEILLTEIKKERENEIERKQELIEDYLKGLVNTVDDVIKKVDKLSKARDDFSEVSSNLGEMEKKIENQFSCVMKRIEELREEDLGDRAGETGEKDKTTKAGEKDEIAETDEMPEEPEKNDDFNRFRRDQLKYGDADDEDSKIPKIHQATKRDYI